MVDPVVLIPRALGHAPKSRPLAYHPFQIKGFPSGFKYPQNAAELKTAHSEDGDDLKHSLALAIVKACIVGTEVNGEVEFFRFERTDWRKLVYKFFLASSNCHLPAKNVRRSQVAAEIVFNTDNECILSSLALTDADRHPKRKPTAGSSKASTSRKGSTGGQQRKRKVRIDSEDSEDEPIGNKKRRVDASIEGKLILLLSFDRLIQLPY